MIFVICCRYKFSESKIVCFNYKKLTFLYKNSQNILEKCNFTANL